MAYFKLSLLDYTNSETVNALKFLPSVVSEFYSQSTEQASKRDQDFAQHKQSFCYTYNESFSLHTNAQKELTFSIDRMILKDNEWIENPYARYMIIGVQLCLEDQFHNQYFFTIKDVKYTFKLMNMSAVITCQDTFSYQLTRQNDGYKIENNKEDQDFIGAKNIDWWIQQKVVPECHIPYTYVSLNQGVYLLDTGEYYVASEKPKNIKQIIKAPYPYNEYKEYYETFPFSGSGNANSILISIGSQIGLSLNTFEHSLINTEKEQYNSNYFITYFWFEPAKHEVDSGLYYSPFSNIQQFSLSHSGSNLTTVMNVEGKNDSDDIVSLLPEIPNFFLQSFHSNEWAQSKWNANFFTDWIYGRVEHYESDKTATGFRIWHGQLSGNTQPVIDSYQIISASGIPARSNTTIKFDNNSQLLYFPISNSNDDIFTISSLYSDYRFSTENHTFSYIRIQNQKGEEIVLDSYSHKFEIVIIDDEGNETSYNSLMQGQQYNASAFLKITTDQLENFTSGRIIKEDIYLNWYREPTVEDQEFAEIADQIPWLENKIIDFSYFYKHDILNKVEYDKLLNIFYNDLRIANGKLLFYTKEYYAALHKKTQVLADITNQFDMLGATFAADIVTPYTTKKITTDISNFANAYENIFAAKASQQKESFINFDETYTSYVNKYINAQQRFLKNIYDFDEYFNAPVAFYSPSACLYTDTIQLVNPEIDKLFAGAKEDVQTCTMLKFNNQTFNYLTENTIEDYYDTDETSDTYGKPSYTIYQISKDNSSLGLIDVFYKNCDGFNTYKHAKNIAGKTFKVCESYDKHKTYYRPAIRISITKEQYDLFNNAKNLTIKLINQSTLPLLNLDSHYDWKLTVATINGNKQYYFIYWKVIVENSDIVQPAWINRVSTPDRLELYDKDTMLSTFVLGTWNLNTLPYTFEFNKGISEYYLPVQYNEIYNNYIALNHNGKGWYTRIIGKYNYQPMSLIIKFLNKMAEISEKTIIPTNEKDNTLINEWPTIFVPSYWLNLYFNQDSANKELLTFGSTLSDVISNIPLSNYFYRDYNYQITAEPDRLTWTDENDNTYYSRHIDKYTICNNQNQTLLDYLLNANEQTNKNIVNPYDLINQKLYSLPILTPDNSSQFYGYNWLGQLQLNSLLSYTLDKYQFENDLWKNLKIANKNYSYYTTKNQYSLKNLAYHRQQFLKYYEHPEQYKILFTKERIWIQDNKGNQYSMNDNYFSDCQLESVNSIKPTSPYLLVYYYDELTGIETEKGYMILKDKDDNTKGWKGDYCTYAQYFTPYWWHFFVCADVKTETYWNKETYKKVERSLDINKCFYQDKWIRPLKETDEMNLKDSYVFIPMTRWVGEHLTQYLNHQYDISKPATSTTIQDPSAMFASIGSHSVLSQIIHYPWMNSSIPVVINNIDKTKQVISLQDYANTSVALYNDNILNVEKIKDYSTYTLYTITYQSDEDADIQHYYGVFCRLEDYVCMPYTPADKWTAYNSKDNASLYDGAIRLDPTTQNDFGKEFFYLQDYDSDLEPISINTFNLTDHYYNQNNERVYTIKQLMDKNADYRYAVLNAQTISKDSLSSDTLELKTDVILARETYQRVVNKPMHQFVLDEEIANYMLASRPNIGDSIQYFFKNNNSSEYKDGTVLSIVDDTITVLFNSLPTITPISYQISKINNKDVKGIIYPYEMNTFFKKDQIRWKLMKSENAHTYSVNFTVPSVSDKSIIYTSSKSILAAQFKDVSDIGEWYYTWKGKKQKDLYNCTNGEFWYLYKDSINQPVLFEYAATIAAQLEEYWTTAYTASQYCEFFLPEHWQPVSDGEINYFSDNIVNVVKNGDQIKCSLSYQFIPHVCKYYDKNKTNQLLPKYTLTYHNDAASYLKEADLETQNISLASAVFKDNLAMQQISNAAQLDWNDFSAVTYDGFVTTYYYTDFGGMTYQNLITWLKIPTTYSFNQYNGLYIMTIKWLKQYYNNHPTDTYTNARKKHDEIWYSIYKNYPSIILENKYSNTDATTSKDLLLLAQNAFKDLSNPERGYSITLINDANECEGYYGQELKIGDSIRVRGNEFYNGFDDISRSLNQLLFITDIKYDLRKDTDISLTVNAIKYQDKLIQRLAKLIK